MQEAVELSEHRISFSGVWCFSDKISSFLEYFGAWIAGEEPVRGVHDNSQGVLLTEYGSYKEGTEGTAVPRDEQCTIHMVAGCPSALRVTHKEGDEGKTEEVREGTT